MNQLDKLLDILKKSGESRIIIMDRQTGEFYVLNKWDWEDTDKTKKKAASIIKKKEIAGESDKEVKTEEIVGLDEIAESGNEVFDEERFFMG